jgi:hypothetical protein
MTPVKPFWQTESHALIAPGIMLPQAQFLTALLPSSGAFMIAREAPIRLRRPFCPTLAH